MARDSVDPVQEAMIAARQNQILDAATTVFAEKGFERATIRDVAKAAGVADGTIYNYFENKTALLLGLLDRLNETDQRDDDMAMANEMDLRTFVKGYIQQRFNLFTGQGLNVFRAVLPEIMANAEVKELYVKTIVEPTFAQAEKHYAKLVKDGKVSPMDVPLTLRLISAIVLGILVLGIIDEPVVRDQWDDIPEALADMILDGISPKT